MRIVVPYTRRDPRVAESLPASAEWADVSANEYAYWRLLRRVWDDRDDLMVVEHDVVIHGTVISQFEECPEPWCVFGYDNICHPECQEAWANMLGCTRFRKGLMAAVPDAVWSIAGDTREWRNQDPRDWHNLCDSIAGDKVSDTPAELRPGSLRAAGFSHHWHTPPIHHISWEGHPR